MTLACFGQMHAQQTGTPDRAVAAAAAGTPAATAPLQPPVAQDPVEQQVPTLSESQASPPAEDSSVASPASKGEGDSALASDSMAPSVGEGDSMVVASDTLTPSNVRWTQC